MVAMWQSPGWLRILESQVFPRLDIVAAARLALAEAQLWRLTKEWQLFKHIYTEQFGARHTLARDWSQPIDHLELAGGLDTELLVDVFDSLMHRGHATYQIGNLMRVGLDRFRPRNTGSWCGSCLLAERELALTEPCRRGGAAWWKPVDPGGTHNGEFMLHVPPSHTTPAKLRQFKAATIQRRKQHFAAFVRKASAAVASVYPVHRRADICRHICMQQPRMALGREWEVRRWLESMLQLREVAHECFLELTEGAAAYPMLVHVSDEFMSEASQHVIAMRYDPRVHCCGLQEGDRDDVGDWRGSDTALLINWWKNWEYVDMPYIEWAALDGEWGLLSQNGEVVIWGALSEMLAAKSPQAFSDGWLVLESSSNPLNAKSFLRDHRHGINGARDWGLGDAA